MTNQSVKTFLAFLNISIYLSIYLSIHFIFIKFQRVYWSDAVERAIYRAFLNGTGKEEVLNASNGVGSVEGELILMCR